MKLIISCCIGVFLLGCTPQADKSDKEILGVQTILWTQYAAECEALFLQGFNIASEIIAEYDFRESEKRPAVTLDLDETVLDNSPFSVEMIRQGYNYSEEKWAEWCKLKKATALPGALSFTSLADSLGIEVFYVSNRSSALMDVTIDNLKSLNFPNADRDHVLLKDNTSSKDARRNFIREHYDIILLIGDNLGDFDGVFDDRSTNYGKNAVRENEKAFGTRFIILPNPMYGSWERGVFPNGMPSEKEILERLRAYD